MSVGDRAQPERGRGCLLGAQIVEVQSCSLEITNSSVDDRRVAN